MGRDAVELPVLEVDFPPEEVYTELQVLEEDFPLEEDYVKDIPPLPRSHPTARRGTIYSPESALSSSEAPQQTASPEAKAEVIVETTPGSPAMEEPTLDLPVHPTSVAALISTLMSLQAKRHEATSL